MKIHLIRHAEAIDRSVDMPDAHRYLTCRGRTRFRRVASSLKKLGIDPDIILTSPLVRAVQTADILAETLRFTSDLVVSPLLASEFQVSHLRDILFSYADAREIVLVGHEPDMGEVVRVLLDLPSPCAMKKGGAVSFSLNPKQTSLEPEFLNLVTGGGKVIVNLDKALDRIKAL
jgi:phosphohistidine phosphatase